MGFFQRELKVRLMRLDTSVSGSVAKDIVQAPTTYKNCLRISPSDKSCSICEIPSPFIIPGP